RAMSLSTPSNWRSASSQIASSRPEGHPYLCHNSRAQAAISSCIGRSRKSVTAPRPSPAPPTSDSPLREVAEGVAAENAPAAAGLGAGFLGEAVADEGEVGRMDVMDPEASPARHPSASGAAR